MIPLHEKGPSSGRAIQHGDPLMNDTPRKAVVLLSGGLDSTTAAAVAMSEGYSIYALSIDYGQRHRFELGCATRVAEAIGVEEHKTVAVDLGTLGGSALTDDIAVPQRRSGVELASGIPITYVPARNTVMLSLALGYAEVVGAGDLWIGVNAVDYSGYPDCRPEFIEAFARVANLSTKAGVEAARVGSEGEESPEGGWFKIHTPLISLTKAQIVALGTELGVDYGLTHTCYAPDAEGISCGVCDACQLRLKGFAEAGLADPIAYQTY